MWAVRSTARFVPAASCLTQAITAQILLAHHGEKTCLRIGVTKDEKGEFKGSRLDREPGPYHYWRRIERASVYAHCSL
jgi:hypothetical protein